jgi:carboxypeptidase PM20D1
MNISAQLERTRADRYASHLAAMIQCKTINSGDSDNQEAEAQEFIRLRTRLREMYPRCFAEMEEIDLGGGALLLRLPSENSSEGAVVLMAHHDVVSADGEWKYPPFDGLITDEVVWGRGTVDIKGALCAIFEAVEETIEERVKPFRDIYISSSNNEETSGDGAPLAVKYFFDHHIKVDLVNDEGGRVYENPLPGVKGKFALVSVAEKGFGTIKFTAKSDGGHASAEVKKMPIAQLAAFINHVERHSPFKIRLTPEIKRLFRVITPHMRFKHRFLLGCLLLFRPAIGIFLPRASPQIAAMLKTTCVFTVIEGGNTTNSIPESASVTANLRFIQHQPMDPSIAALRKIADRYGLKTEFVKGHDCSPTTDMNGVGFRFISSCIHRIYLGVEVAPMVLIAGTDARHFSRICPNTIRFAPFVMTRQQLASVHGVDENISVSSLVLAVDYYKLLVFYQGDDRC